MNSNKSVCKQYWACFGFFPQQGSKFEDRTVFVGCAGRGINAAKRPQSPSELSNPNSAESERMNLWQQAVCYRSELLDHGGIQERIEVGVCNLLPLLVLKSFAIDERDKSKDSYDLVWILNAFQEGPASVVDAIASSPVIDHADIPAAIQAIRTHFQSPGHRGPSQYANFELMADDAEQRERLRLHAHGTVAEFLRLWDSRGLPGAIG